MEELPRRRAVAVLVERQARESPRLGLEPVLLGALRELDELLLGRAPQLGPVLRELLGERRVDGGGTIRRALPGVALLLVAQGLADRGLVGRELEGEESLEEGIVLPAGLVELPPEGGVLLGELVPQCVELLLELLLLLLEGVVGADRDDGDHEARRRGERPQLAALHAAKTSAALGWSPA